MATLAKSTPKPPTRPQKPPDNRPPNKPKPGRYWALAVLHVTGWALYAYGLWGAVSS